MGRGPTVQAQKEASAKVKSKINAIHAKLIAIAAERGADLGQNHALADAVSAAKKAGVTADVIDRAIKRGAGLDTDTKKVEEVLYEGYVPGGVAVIIRALTDNRNRTAPNIRHIFSAATGNLGETGSVSNYLFDHLGQITLPLPADLEAFELALLETEAQDYRPEGENMFVFTDRTALMSVKQALAQQGYASEKAEFVFLPKNYIEVTDFDTALHIYMFLEACHDDEDIEAVWNNADISDELWSQVQSHVESHRFRT